MIGNKRPAPAGVGSKSSEEAKKKPKSETSKSAIIKGAWSPAEDEQMLVAVKKHGTDWKAISAHVKGRTAKQCRDRYKLKLDPSINHGPWSPEEDKSLLKFHEQLGRQWTKIAKMMPGRTENSVKSRYASLLRSKTKEWTEQEDLIMRQLREQNIPFEDIAEKHLPHRSEHAVKKRWERLFMRDLAKKIRSEMPALNKVQPQEDDYEGDGQGTRIESQPRLNPTLAAATNSSPITKPVIPSFSAPSAVSLNHNMEPHYTNGSMSAAQALLGLPGPSPHFTVAETPEVPQYNNSTNTAPAIVQPSMKFKPQTQDQVKRANRFKRHSTSTTVMMQIIGEPLK